MRFYPKNFGGKRTDPEIIKQEGWHQQGILVIADGDRRLTWPERELIKQLGEKLYGKRMNAGEQQ